MYVLFSTQNSFFSIEGFVFAAEGSVFSAETSQEDVNAKTNGKDKLVGSELSSQELLEKIDSVRGLR